MRASQRVRLIGGGAQTYPNIGFLKYTIAPPHQHWHLMDFQRYELRRASDHSLVVADRKSGFCLADHWALVPGHVPGKPRRPVFHSNCKQFKPGALAVEQGTSVGYTDRYPAYFHGQNLDVTRVPTGTTSSCTGQTGSCPYGSCATRTTPPRCACASPGRAAGATSRRSGCQDLPGLRMVRCKSALTAALGGERYGQAELGRGP